MGDFVNKQLASNREQHVQKTFQWDSSEQDEVTSVKEQITIKNFSLNAVEGSNGDLDGALQQWQSEL